MECEFCHEIKADVRVLRDPYVWDVYSEEWRVPMCDACEQRRYDEI